MRSVERDVEPARNTQDRRASIASSILALLIIVVSIGSLLATLYFSSQRVKSVQETLREQQTAANRQASDAKATQDARRSILKTQVGLELIELFNRPEMRLARKRFAVELLHGQEVHELRVLQFFETLAVYQQEDRIDEDTVYSLFDPVTNYWAASRRQIQKWRKKSNDDSLYRDFEELNDILILDTGSERRGSNVGAPSKAGVKRFLESEASLPS